MQIHNLLLYLLSFGVLWYGSGLIVDSVKLLARKIKVPSFAFSFFVLGFLTSIPEMGVGLHAISEGRPEIFVGNLLGSVIVLFLFVIPLLAVISKGIPVKKHINGKNLFVALAIIGAPALFALDQRVTTTEGVILIALYVALFYVIRSRGSIFARLEKVIAREQKDWRHSTLLKLAIGIIVVFAASRFIVDQTVALSEAIGLSVFVVSLLVLSIGTNLPELSLALRSVTKQAEDIALGDYLGSAASNSMLFGVFTLINNGDVITETKSTATFLVILSALVAFFMLTYGKNKLTRKEGFALLGFYVLIVLFEASSFL